MLGPERLVDDEDGPTVEVGGRLANPEPLGVVLGEWMGACWDRSDGPWRWTMGAIVVFSPK